jgi:hypothetical protein
MGRKHMSRITSHQYNWTATTRLHGEGVLRHDMTAHEQRRPPPPPSSGGGCTDATRGWECSSNSVPSIYRLAGWWHKAPSRVVEGRVVSCRFAPRRRSQRETRSVPTLSSAVFRRQIARTAVTCPHGHGLGWVGLHDRILWEVGFAQEWKVELDTDMCICRLGGENGVTHEVLEALSSGRVLPICVQEHCPRHVYLPK